MRAAVSREWRFGGGRARLSLPPTFWAYLVGSAVVFGLSFLPSSVETIYTWWGVAVEVLLLYGLARGSHVARLLLAAVGVLGAVGGVMVQMTPLDPWATSQSCLLLGVTCLLFTPSLRAHTRSRRDCPPGDAASARR